MNLRFTAYRVTSGRPTLTDNLHNSTNKFDFVMANPRSTSMGGQERIKDDPHYPLGMPQNGQRKLPVDTGVHSSLRGGAGLDSVSPLCLRCQGSEMEIRKRLIEERAVDVMVSVGSNFFCTVTLPCTSGSLIGAKEKARKGQGSLHRC